MFADYAVDEGLDSLFILYASALAIAPRMSEPACPDTLPLSSREENWSDPVVGCKNTPHLCANALAYRVVLDVGSTVSIALVQILLKAEVVVVALNGQVVAGIRECFQTQFPHGRYRDPARQPQGGSLEPWPRRVPSRHWTQRKWLSPLYGAALIS